MNERKKSRGGISSDFYVHRKWKSFQKKIFSTIFYVYIDEEINKGGTNMKIKPTNDLLFKKMMTTTGKEYILEDFSEAVTGMKLTNVRPTNP